MTSRRELAVREHQNWIAYLTSVVSCTTQANVTRADGVVTILAGLPMDWFSQVLIEHEEATPAGVLAGVAQGRERGDPFVVRLREEIDDRFIPTLTRAGLAAARGEPSTPGMVAFPIDDDTLAEHAAPDLEIRRVTDAAGLHAHRQVVTAGFGSDPAVALGTACQDLLDRPECVVYVGYADDVPVVSGLGWRTGRTVGVFSIATVASARRRGYGAAMTARVVADGVVVGCEIGALQASELGRPIYERLGFRTVVRYIAYVDPVDGSRIGQEVREGGVDPDQGMPRGGSMSVAVRERFVTSGGAAYSTTRGSFDSTASPGQRAWGAPPVAPS